MPDHTDDAPDTESPAVEARRPGPLSRRKKVCFGLLAVVLLLGLGELTLRLVRPRLAWDAARTTFEGGLRLKRHDSEWPATYPKNARGWQTYIEFDVPVAYNADGFRGPNFDPAAGPVVILLGDSYTAGYGVEYERTFAVALQNDLRDRFGKVQVWNLGRAGSGTVVQVRFLERILDRYPDADVRAVMLVSNVSPRNGGGNDLVDLRPNMPYLKGGRPEKPHRRPPPLRARLRQSALLHGTEIMFNRWLRENVRLSEIENLDQAWNNYCRCLDRARQLCDRRGASLIVAYLAVRPSEKPETIREFTERFRSYLGKYDVPLVVCSPKQDPELEAGSWFYPIDGHLNGVGHRYCAEQFTPALRRALESGTTPRPEPREPAPRN